MQLFVFFSSSGTWILVSSMSEWYGEAWKIGVGKVGILLKVSNQLDEVFVWLGGDEECITAHEWPLLGKMIDCWTAHKQSHWGTKKYCFDFLTVGLSVDTCAEQTEVFSDEERNRHTLIINPEERETVQCDSPVIIRKTMCFNDHRSFLSFFSAHCNSIRWNSPSSCSWSASLSHVPPSTASQNPRPSTFAFSRSPLLILNALLNSYPYCNPDLDIDERVEDLVSRMTLDEAIFQTWSEAPAIEHLGMKYVPCSPISAREPSSWPKSIENLNLDCLSP